MPAAAVLAAASGATGGLGALCRSALPALSRACQHALRSASSMPAREDDSSLQQKVGAVQCAGARFSWGVGRRRSRSRGGATYLSCRHACCCRATASRAESCCCSSLAPFSLCAAPAHPPCLAHTCHPGPRPHLRHVCPPCAAHLPGGHVWRAQLLSHPGGAGAWRGCVHVGRGRQAVRAEPAGRGERARAHPEGGAARGLQVARGVVCTCMGW